MHPPEQNSNGVRLFAIALAPLIAIGASMAAGLVMGTSMEKDVRARSQILQIMAKPSQLFFNLDRHALLKPAMVKRLMSEVAGMLDAKRPGPSQVLNAQLDFKVRSGMGFELIKVYARSPGSPGDKLRIATRFRAPFWKGDVTPLL